MDTYEVNVNTGYGIGGGFYNFAWTTEPPTQEGLYFYYDDFIKHVKSIMFYSYGNGEFGDESGDFTTNNADSSSRYLGPIPLPEKPE